MCSENSSDRSLSYYMAHLSRFGVLEDHSLHYPPQILEEVGQTVKRENLHVSDTHPCPISLSLFFSRPHKELLGGFPSTGLGGHLWGHPDDTRAADSPSWHHLMGPEIGPLHPGTHERPITSTGEIRINARLATWGRTASARPLSDRRDLLKVFLISACSRWRCGYAFRGEGGVMLLLACPVQDELEL